MDMQECNDEITVSDAALIIYGSQGRGLVGVAH